MARKGITVVHEEYEKFYLSIVGRSLCEKEFNKVDEDHIKVRDHDNFSGKFRGAAHQK